MEQITEQFVIRSIFGDTQQFPCIQPTHFGYGTCKPFHTGGIRVLNHWVLHYVFSGTGIFETRGKIYHPKAGEMFVIRPNEWAFYAADGKNPWTYGWFDFFSDMPMPAVLEQDVIADERLSAVFLSAYEQGRVCPAERRPAFVYGKMFELLGLLRCLYPAADKPTTNVLIHKVRQHLEENYRERISVADMAQLVHMEPSHFVTLFREVTGITPWNYLTNIRLSRATSALMYRKCSVKETAERVGYADATSFSRSFRRQFGMSPTEFVQKYRQYAQRQNNEELGERGRG